MGTFKEAQYTKYQFLWELLDLLSSRVNRNRTRVHNLKVEVEFPDCWTLTISASTGLISESYTVSTSMVHNSVFLSCQGT